MGAPSLLELWTKFKADKAPSLQPTTLSTDYVQVERWLARCPIQKSKKGRDVVAWLLTQEPKQSARKVVGYVRSMYRWACSESIGILEKNPVKDYAMPKMPQRDEEVRVLPKEKTHLVIAALKRQRNTSDAQWDVWAEFMLQTGMRTGEVRALKWPDLKDGYVLVHRNYTLTHGLKESTKTNKQRKVPLNERAKQILSQLPRNNEFIFPWDREAFQSFFRRKMQTLHFSGAIDFIARPYDLRHTAISRWIESGIPVTQCAKWAGNTPEVIWKYYANATQEFEMPNL